MIAERFSRLLFEQIPIHGARAHHDDFFLQRGAFGGGLLILPFGGGNLRVEGDKAEITPLPRHQVIGEIKGQADPDHGDQVLAKDIALLDESLHNS